MSDLQAASPESSEAIRPRRLQHIKAEFAKHSNRPSRCICTNAKRSAISSFGGTLEGLNPKMVNNLVGAISNARADGRSREPSAPAAAKSTDEDDTITATAECSPPTS